MQAATIGNVAEGFDELVRQKSLSEFNHMMKFIKATRPDTILLCLKNGSRFIAEELKSKFEKTSSIICVKSDAIHKSPNDLKEVIVTKLKPLVMDILDEDICNALEKHTDKIPMEIINVPDHLTDLTYPVRQENDDLQLLLAEYKAPPKLLELFQQSPKRK